LLRNFDYKRIMMISPRFLVTLAATVLMAGCAGTNFKRPDAQALVVGKSTSADVTRVMGDPRQVGEALKNEQKIKIARYSYAATSGDSLYPGVIPARAMSFSTFNDLLVGQQFLSSFKEDATEFDDSKIKDIVKGKTTKDEVISLLGKPAGEAIYPVIKRVGDTALVYGYSHVKGNAFNLRNYSKSLMVSIDSAGIVADVDYSSGGEK
jgi:hypothetical protein